MSAAWLSTDAGTLSVKVPLAIRRRGGRKQVVSPVNTPAWSPPRAHIDSTLVKALARAFRWRSFLESGRYQSVQEIAAAERISYSYLCRVLRMTLLAPEIVESILDGTASSQVTMVQLQQPLPVRWHTQRERLAF